MQTIPFDTIVRFQPKGLLIVPKKLREAVGLEENGFARIRRNNRQLIIESVRVLPYPVRSYNDEEVQEFLDLDANETTKLKDKNLL